MISNHGFTKTAVISKIKELVSGNWDRKVVVCSTFILYAYNLQVLVCRCDGGWKRAPTRQLVMKIVGMPFWHWSEHGWIFVWRATIAGMSMHGQLTNQQRCVQINHTFHEMMECSRTKEGARQARNSVQSLREWGMPAWFVEDAYRQLV